MTITRSTSDAAPTLTTAADAPALTTAAESPGVPAMTSAPNTAPTSPLSAPAATRPLRLLLADDNAADVALLTDVLAVQGAPVAIQTARDGVEALGLLRASARERPDVVLLDLNMPRMGGLEALAAIKSDPALRHLPVLVLTTSDAPEDIRRAYDLGATSYLTKPRTLSETMDLARALLAFWTRVVPLPAPMA